ncbi:MAG: WG repeat-containing protein [Clostridia bacterium]|nr:WG repeat-containing protein [Clostridia bacterium]
MKKLLVCLLLLTLALPCALAEWYHLPEGYVVTEENGLYGLADAQGRVILPCIYGQEPIVWEEPGCIYVMQDGLFGLLALDGSAILAPEWDNLYSPDEGHTLWMAFRGEMVTNWRSRFREPGEGLWALYSADGTELSPLQWTKIGKLADGLMVVEKDGLKGVMNTRGEIVIPVEWEYIQGPCLERLVVAKDGRYAMLDAAGEQVIPLTECLGMHLNFDGTVTIRQGTDVPEHDEVYSLEGAYDLTGREITPCVWRSMSWFSEGLACVYDGSVFGYINWQGELVIPCQWQSADDFAGGHAIVQQDGLYGVIDTTGALVVPCEWEKLESLGDGQFRGTRTTMIDLKK